MSASVGAVKEFWNRGACGTSLTDKPRFTKEYFDEIEEVRYRLEPEIFSFAQFTRHHGERVLEVGVGAGTDFTQWIRAGTKASGVDLTEEGVEHVRQRLALYHLRAEDLRVADAEHLPHADNSFDLVYSWGVIHHTPDTEKAFSEIVRVCRPGGVVKVMVYHRRSLVAFFLWARRALLAGRPWKSFAWCLARYMESPGTKAYLKSEITAMAEKFGLEDVRIRTWLTCHDRLYKFTLPLRAVASALAYLCGGNRVGWFLTLEARKRA